MSLISISCKNRLFKKHSIQLVGLLLGSFRAALRRLPSPDKHHVGLQSCWGLGGVCLLPFGIAMETAQYTSTTLACQLRLDTPRLMCEWQRAFCPITPTARPLDLCARRW